MNALMTRLGFNPDTRNEIYAQGFATMDDIKDLDESQSKTMAAMISRRNVGNPDVNVMTTSLNKLLACAYWARERERLGLDLLPAALSNVRIREVIRQMRAEDLAATLAKDFTPTKPKPLTDLAKWPVFWNVFQTFMNQSRGAAMCPLTYVIRDHEEVTPAMLLDQYDSDDERLVGTTLLSGAHFLVDSQRVYDELKDLIIDEPAWVFIMKHDVKRDGRKACDALRQQCEGDSTKHVRKQKAYAAIAASQYSGERRNFTFTDYIGVHERAHNELVLLKVHVPDDKQVMDFLAGIKAPEMSSAVAHVIGDTEKKNDFFLAQTYLSNFIETTQTLNKMSRNVSFAASGASGDGHKKPYGKGKGKGGRYQGGKSSGNNANRGIARNYTREEWHALSDEEKTKVQQLRAEWKKSPEGKKRNVKAAARETANPTDEDEPTKDAGNQFGRNGHKKSKNNE
jgi:hypothetical protein